MKSCPTCLRVYADDTLRFCLEDGAPLSTEVRPGTERTLALPTNEARGPAPTEVLDDPALAPTLPARESSAATLRRETPRAARRSTASVVALTVVATVLLLGLGGVVAWQLLKDDKKGDGGNVNTNTTGGVVSTPTPPPPPAEGFIEGSMAYPSDGIPGVMVACAEKVETPRAPVCSEKRQDWEDGVRYSLRLPPGRYYVYATLLPGDDSVGELTGKRAYYTDYMKCGMGANCNSHRRIVLEVEPGVTLNGVTVGDWWADL